MKQESFCVAIRDVPFWFYVRESEHILGHLSLHLRELNRQMCWMEDEE